MPTTIFPGETFLATLSPYYISVEFRAPGRNQDAPSMTITLPLVVAKQLCMALRKQVRIYEEQAGIITVPPDSYKTLGVSPEDWEGWLK